LFWSGHVLGRDSGFPFGGECNRSPLTKGPGGRPDGPGESHDRRDRRFYGVTYDGGAFQRGSLFSVDGELQHFVILHEFGGPNGIYYPNGPLLLANDDDFYGTTQNNGTVFRLTPDSRFKTLHVFTGEEGGEPNGGLIQASDGNLYDTTWDGT